MQAVINMLKREEEQLKLKCREEGREEGRIELIKTMLKENISLEIIKKVTNLSEKEIEEIKNLKK